jgi:hypothetical protein
MVKRGDADLSLRCATDRFRADQGTSCTAVALRVTRGLPFCAGYLVGHLHDA